ncbi:MAG: hypothetical protein ACLTTH_04840 [Holdemanella porci]
MVFLLAATALEVRLFFVQIQLRQRKVEYINFVGEFILLGTMER